MRRPIAKIFFAIVLLLGLSFASQSILVHSQSVDCDTGYVAKVSSPIFTYTIPFPELLNHAISRVIVKDVQGGCTTYTALSTEGCYLVNPFGPTNATVTANPIAECPGIEHVEFYIEEIVDEPCDCEPTPTPTPIPTPTPTATPEPTPGCEEEQNLELRVVALDEIPTEPTPCPTATPEPTPTATPEATPGPTSTPTPCTEFCNDEGKGHPTLAAIGGGSASAPTPQVLGASTLAATGATEELGAVLILTIGVALVSRSVYAKTHSGIAAR